MDARLLLILAVICAPSRAAKLNFQSATARYYLDYWLRESINVETRIIGGIEATPQSHPYQVGIVVPVNSSIIFCGASIIDQMNLLTAAHCLDSLEGPIVAYFGAHYIPPTLADDAVAVLAEDIVIHPQWDRNTFKNDIAIIQLPQPLEFSASINRILLPRDDSEEYTGNTCLVTGWGSTNESAKDDVNEVLMELSSDIMSNYACSLAYLGSVEDSNICMSSYIGRATCGGDSGGPLTVNRVQVGISSFESRWGCAQGFPSVFTRITYYLDWISANLAPIPMITTTTTPSPTTTTPSPTTTTPSPTTTTPSPTTTTPSPTTTTPSPTTTTPSPTTTTPSPPTTTPSPTTTTPSPTTTTPSPTTTTPSPTTTTPSPTTTTPSPTTTTPSPTTTTPSPTTTTPSPTTTTPSPTTTTPSPTTTTPSPTTTTPSPTTTTPSPTTTTPSPTTTTPSPTTTIPSPTTIISSSISTTTLETTVSTQTPPTTATLDPPVDGQTTVSPIDLPTVPTVETTVSVDHRSDNYATVYPIDTPTVPVITITPAEPAMPTVTTSSLTDASPTITPISEATPDINEFY